MKLEVIPKGRSYGLLRRGIGVAYAEKSGSLVLKGETHWTKINCIWINTRWGCLWFVFRREFRWPK